MKKNTVLSKRGLNSKGKDGVEPGVSKKRKSGINALFSDWFFSAFEIKIFYYKLYLYIILL